MIEIVNCKFSDSRRSGNFKLLITSVIQSSFPLYFHYISAIFMERITKRINRQLHELTNAFKFLVNKGYGAGSYLNWSIRSQLNVNLVNSENFRNGNCKLLIKSDVRHPLPINCQSNAEVADKNNHAMTTQKSRKVAPVFENQILPHVVAELPHSHNWLILNKIYF